MKVKVRLGDRVVYRDTDRRSMSVDLKGSKEKIVGQVMFKTGSCYSVRWLTPKMYQGYTFVPEDMLLVLLKKNDERWNVIHSQEASAVVAETPNS